MANDFLLELTTDLITAHLSNNAVTADQLPGLITAVHSSLVGLGKPEELPAVRLEPAVSIRSSVKPDAVTCLACGAKMQLLKRHIAIEHGMSPSEYRRHWGLALDHPLVAPNYAARRKAFAHEFGLGTLPGRKAKAAKPKAAPRKKSPPRSPEPAPPPAPDGAATAEPIATTASSPESAIRKPRRKLGIKAG